jgi:hypothetical protein
LVTAFNSIVTSTDLGRRFGTGHRAVLWAGPWRNRVAPGHPQVLDRVPDSFVCCLPSGARTINRLNRSGVTTCFDAYCSKVVTVGNFIWPLCFHALNLWGIFLGWSSGDTLARVCLRFAIT